MAREKDKAVQAVDISSLLKMKKKGQKITMLTAYDTPTARMLDDAGIDVLLVGDSAANVVLGYKDTLPVTMDEMIHHTKAVSRGVKRAMVLGDMPFMSYNISHEDAVRNAGRFIKEGGAQAVKLEGGAHVVDTVERLFRAGIPVVGHLGLTPQTAGMQGGYRVQGKTAATAARIVEDALKLQEAGAFMLILECVPDRVGEHVSKALEIPVVGIGAGPGCDGQVLVFHDMVGIGTGFSPKFVRRYANLGQEIVEAASRYKQDVQQGSFPAKEHCFTIKDSEFELLVKKR
ncbi:MAG: 3-methyl-2-oxobutanoate hydroxymethyltransferase [Deltaproteobacteria bacterium]|nr:3-methyl-2-oxobutanoate hydroxymethyltransferase [Deltaproteobacteria bacterium]